MNTENDQLTSQFLTYLEKVRQNDPKSVDLRRVHLRRLLIWAGDQPIERAKTITPTFPAYLETGKNEHTGRQLSARFIRDTCITVRSFLKWIGREDPTRFSGLDENWITSIRPGNTRAMHSELHDHKFYTLDDVRRLLAVPTTGLIWQREKATIAMLFLSGMRIGAMVTIPISCIDLTSRRISQLPSEGVATKFHKAAVTSLLPIPDLLAVVTEWDNLIRPTQPVDCPWYTLMSNRGGHLRDGRGDGDAVHRRTNFARNLRKLCALAGIPYRSPHAMRHGFAVYGLKNAKDIKELKAVSQNMMHGSMGITDGLYGNLTADDVAATMASLGSTPTPPAGPAMPGDLGELLQVLAKLQQNPDLKRMILAA